MENRGSGPGRRRSFTPEFKQEAVRLVTQGSRSTAQAARELGISANLLARWKQQFEAQSGDAAHAFPGHGTPADAELARLERELDLMRQERDILKKAVGIFSRQPR